MKEAVRSMRRKALESVAKDKMISMAEKSRDASNNQKLSSHSRRRRSDKFLSMHMYSQCNLLSSVTSKHIE